MIRKVLIFLSFLIGATFWLASPANAQATRTWVSGVGDDANPCSRTAPCKTFAGAISKTATAGEINCLDPGGFGGVTIVKSISIVCDYTEGGVLSAGAGVNGIVVNLPAVTDRVFLSGIDMNGAGNAQNGLRVVSGGVVHLQNSIIRNYRASNGLGVSYQPAGAGFLSITDSTIADNGTGATGGGILIQPTGAGGNARVYLRNVRAIGNAGPGLNATSVGNTGSGNTIVVEDSVFDGNGTGIATAGPVNTTSVAVMLDNITTSNNTTGISATGPNLIVRVAHSTITGNATGLTSSAQAQLLTYGNNRLDGNPTFGAPNNGAFTAAAIPEQ